MILADDKSLHTFDNIGAGVEELHKELL